MSKITIETDERTLERLNALAARLEKSQEALVRQAIEAYVQQFEERTVQEKLAAYALPSWEEDDDIDEFLAYLRAERQQSV